MAKQLPSDIMDRSQSKQVLLVADANPENINVLKMMLASGYEIKVAADGKEAIRLASSPDAPGLILLNNMIGFSEKELIGAHLKKFISAEEFIKNTKRYSDRIAGLNLPRIYKSQVIHSDGTTIDVELNVCVVPYGRSLAALVFMRDIREEEAWKYCI